MSYQAITTMSNNNNQHGTKTNPKGTIMACIPCGNEQLSNWTVETLNNREIMPGHWDSGLVKLWILEWNLQLPHY